ncbi:MAG: SMR family transporter [Anaerolineae bacterium]|jgi:multidrug transporter EmrE-like cation transporter|nr:SMR family transporter [Anaerolineae bacterium]
MLRGFFRAQMEALQGHPNVQVAGLVGCNLLFNIIANSSFKMSAASSNWRGFLAWQVVGNLAGLAAVITLTWLLKFLPLHVAYPVTVGLAVIGVQVVGAALLFHEPIASRQWAGTLLVAVGIFLIGGK